MTWGLRRRRSAVVARKLRGGFRFMRLEEYAEAGEGAVAFLYL